MSNAENEKLVLRENAANFFEWISDAKRRLRAEEQAQSTDPQREEDDKSRTDKAA